MNAIFDRVIREFFPDTNIPHWKKWVFRAAFGNKIFSRLINDERLIDGVIEREAPDRSPSKRRP